jgi:hypothetical protein
LTNEKKTYKKPLFFFRTLLNLISAIAIFVLIMTLPEMKLVSASTHALNLTAIPAGLATQLGVSTFTGGIMAFAIFELVFVLPVIFLRQNRSGWLPEMILGFTVMAVAIAIGWLPYYFLLIFSLLVAIMFAGTMRGFITG